MNTFYKALVGLALLPATAMAQEVHLQASRYRDPQNPTVAPSPTQPSLTVPMPNATSNTGITFKGTTASVGLAPQWKLNGTLDADQPQNVIDPTGPQPKVVLGLNYSF